MNERIEQTGAGAPRVLAGDVGGTKVDLGLFESASLIEHRRYDSRAHAGLEAICADFVAAAGGARIAGAAFGVAGPIVDDRVRTTNLPWVVERGSLERILHCPVGLKNDLEATAHGIPFLDAAEIATLNEGVERAGAARAILAAGTGLGEGYMTCDPRTRRYEPQASEGGHADFAARNEAEMDLLRRLLARFGHVSVERVVSGAGITEILEHLTASGRYRASRELRDAIAAGEPAAVIARAAIDRTHPVCVETMRLFVTAYGAEAGNLALKVMALGGVYVGGGIAPKILPLMTGGWFMDGFLDKGRFRHLMERIPVRVILNERAALIGAAAVARGLLER